MEIAKYKALTLEKRKAAAARQLDKVTAEDLQLYTANFVECKDWEQGCRECEMLQFCDVVRAKIGSWEEDEEPEKEPEEEEPEKPVNNREETGVTIITGKFQKGRSGNPKGRPKGAVNKTTQDFRALIKRVMNECFDAKQLREDIESLPPAVRVATFLRLLRYVLPEKKEEDSLFYQPY